MKRRRFLQALAALPFVRWLKPEPAPEVLTFKVRHEYGAAWIDTRPIVLGAFDDVRSIELAPKRYDGERVYVVPETEPGTLVRPCDRDELVIA